MTRVPHVLTYNHQLPNIKAAINKHWDILKIKPPLETIFTEKAIIAFRRNKNLKDILGQKTILNGKVKRNIPINESREWCSPCNSRKFNLCCQQVKNTNTFKSNKPKAEFKIYHRVNCKSYLLECILCGIHSANTLNKSHTISIHTRK